MIFADEETYNVRNLCRLRLYKFPESRETFGFPLLAQLNKICWLPSHCKQIRREVREAEPLELNKIETQRGGGRIPLNLIKHYVS